MNSHISTIVAGTIGTLLAIAFLGFLMIRIGDWALGLIILGCLALAVADFVGTARNPENETR